MYSVCPDGCSHVGFELWQVESGTIFDDIIVTDSLEEAQNFAKETFFKKITGEKKMHDNQKVQVESMNVDEDDDDDEYDMGDEL